MTSLTIRVRLPRTLADFTKVCHTSVSDTLKPHLADTSIKTSVEVQIMFPKKYAPPLR